MYGDQCQINLRLIIILNYMKSIYHHPVISLPILRSYLIVKFSTQNMKKIGNFMVTQLPKIKFPMRMQSPDQEQFPKKLYYDMQGYKYHDRQPRCKYYALEHNSRIYHVYNAYYYPLGRMIQQIAHVIQGKNTPHYKNTQTNVKNGDICVIVNVSDPLITGKKLLYKQFKYHTGFIGHLKSFSYRSVLNRKPELLYYYLLRKAMPKTKLSEEYLQNIKFYRGNTHDLSFLPQFAPDRNLYEYAPEVNVMQILKNSPDLKVIDASEKSLKSINNPHIQKANIKDQTFQQVKKMKNVPSISARQYQKLLRKQKRYEYRYKIIRAPYKKKQMQDQGYQYHTDEKKAKKSPYYQDLLDQEGADQEDQIVQNVYNLGTKQDKTKN